MCIALEKKGKETGRCRHSAAQDLAYWKADSDERSVWIGLTLNFFLGPCSMEGVKTNYLVCIGLTLYIFLIGAKYGYLLCKAGILTVSVPTLLSSLKMRLIRICIRVNRN